MKICKALRCIYYDDGAGTKECLECQIIEEKLENVVYLREQLSEEGEVDTAIDYKEILNEIANEIQKKEINREQRAVIALHVIGFNKKEISERSPLSYSTIKRILTPFLKKQ